ncbi:MAG: hypothetical protein ACM30E_09315, partial [Nitrososphaerales archaeon]
LVRIVDADRARVAESQFEAVRPDSYKAIAETLQKISGTDGGDVLFGLFSGDILGVEPFRKQAIEAAAKLAQLNADQRARLMAALQGLAPASFGLLVVFLKLRLLLMAQTPPTADAWLGVLMDFRLAVIKFWHGTALIVGALRQTNEKVMAQIGELAPFLDQDDVCVIEGNLISGALSVYGEPRPTPDLPEQLNANGIGTLKQLGVVPATSLMGTLQLRGNQVVRITVSQDLLAFLVSIVAGQNKSWLFDAFARTMVTENLIEGGIDVLVGQQVTCSKNEFTGYAAASAQFAPAAGGPVMSLLAVAARTLYLANVGDVPTVIFNVSRAVDQSVNQGVTIQ